MKQTLTSPTYTYHFQTFDTCSTPAQNYLLFLLTTATQFQFRFLFHVQSAQAVLTDSGLVSPELLIDVSAFAFEIVFEIFCLCLPSLLQEWKPYEDRKCIIYLSTSNF